MNLPTAVRAIAAANPAPAKAALVVTPHPLTLQGQRVLDARAALFKPNETLLVLLERHDVRPGEQWVVSIEGARVPEAMWSRTWPVHGLLIEARRVPEKDALRLIAFAALSYFTMGAGGIGGGSFLGLTGATGWIAAGAAFVAGSMVLNKALAPKGQSNRSEQAASPTYSLNGGRNRMRAYEPMGLVLGEPYSVPDLAAQPYTFFASGEQYLWQMFHLGINCADVQTLRIGQTPLESYQGVTVLRNGLATGNSDFPALGTSVDSIAGGALTFADGAVTRTSSANTVRLEVDLVSTVYYVNDDGTLSGLRLDVLAEYRAVGSGTWLPFTPYVPGVPAVTVTRTGATDDSGQPPLTWEEVLVPGIDEVPAGYIRQTGASQKPMRVTKECAVAPGQYEVRLRKMTADSTSTNVSSTVEWVQLKSYQNDTANYDGQSRLAIRIQASGQLNGALDEFNCQKRAKPMPYWNGSTWVTATDRASGLCNPGAIFLLLARGIRDSGGRLLAGLGYSDDQIDIPSLQRFMVHCAEKGFHFDLDLQAPTSIDELLDSIAYAGMAEKSWPDGKLGVNIFRRDDPIESVINMGSIKARSFEVDYATMPTAEEIEVQYFDRARGNTWQPIRVQAPGTTPLREPGRVTLVGVTGEAHAAVLARFAMAQNIYQRKSISCEQDLEYMTHRKGSVVSLSHDMTQWGYSGRLAGFQDVAGTITLTLDERAPADNPTGGPNTRFIALQLPGEQQVRVFPVASFVGESRTVTLSSAWPSGVTQPGNDASNPVRDTKWIYDFKAVPGKRLRMLEISPTANGAREVMVEEPPEFWNYVETGTYQPPPSDSSLRPAPVVTRAFPSEELARQGNTYYTELSLGFEVDGAFGRAELWGAVGPGDVAPAMALLDAGRRQTMTWRGGLDDRWHLELRVYSDARAAEPYRLIYDVRGLREPPPNVEALSISGNSASWPAVVVPDLAGYLIRFNYGINTWWPTATPMHEGVITESPYQILRRPEGLVSVGVKAIDTTGNESAEAVWVTYVFPEVAVSNVLLDFPQSPTFPGATTGGTVVGGELLADDVDSFYEPLDAPMYSPADEDFYAASQYGELVYEFQLTASAPGLLLLQYEIDGDGFVIEYQTGGGEPFYASPDSEPMWEPTDELVYGAPSAWSVWPGSIYVDGAIEARFRITIAGGQTQGAIRSLSAVLDVPDVTEVLENVAISPAGTRLPITKTYNAIKAVIPIVQGGGSGVTARVIDKNPTLGPLVEVLNTSGVAVSGVVDVPIQGF